MYSRTPECDHLQCFDATFFLKMNAQKPTWECPVCKKLVLPTKKNTLSSLNGKADLAAIKQGALRVLLKDGVLCCRSAKLFKWVSVMIAGLMCKLVRIYMCSCIYLDVRLFQLNRRAPFSSLKVDKLFAKILVEAPANAIEIEFDDAAKWTYRSSDQKEKEKEKQGAHRVSGPLNFAALCTAL